MKFVVGKYYVDVALTEDENRYYFKFRYHKGLMAKIKMMKGARWHPDIKSWSAVKCQRNEFQLDYLMGKNPYAKWDRPLLDVTPNRLLFEVQREMLAHTYTHKQVIIAAEMGLGKTLYTFELIELSHKEDGPREWWYVAPKNTCIAIKREMAKWNFKLQLNLMTYEAMCKAVKNWPPGTPAPFGIIFDESHYLANATTQRTQYAMHLADSMRADWEDPYIVLMTGTPQPKKPTSWWCMCEVARPGFLIEGDQHKFQKTMAVVVEKESISGGSYPDIVAWRSTDKICDICGEGEDSIQHMADVDPDAHVYKPAVNEVARLYTRMQGMTLVRLKKNCLDLPDKVYREIYLEPDRQILNAAKLIAKTGGGAAMVQVLLRELSDGFQYEDLPTGKQVTCPGCNGSGEQIYSEVTGHETEVSEPSSVCGRCKGQKTVPEITRQTTWIGSPKQEALREVLAEHEQYNRLVVFAGFQASVDVCVETAQKEGWVTIKIDGRGIDSPFEKPLDVFESDSEQKICYVGHPGSGGTGITLVKSPTICYYSNTHNAVERWQSEDRIHRIGMDVNRGANIIDLFHLPTDKLILDRLKLKKNLQDVSIGELMECLNDTRIY